MSDRVVIVGGGVIGAMCAWYLSNEGHQITIVDRDRFGGACSHGNCGYVCPSHALPLSRPGQIGATLKQMFKRNSSFAVKPRLNLDSLLWFWKFGRRCNQQDMLSAARGRHELLQSSKALYQELVSNESIDCQWKEVGLLFVFDDSEGFDHYATTNELLTREFGVSATPHAADQLVELEPALKSGFGGAWHYEGDCHLRPDLLMAALRRELESRGTRFVEQAAVEKFVSENGVAKAIVAGDQEIEADRFVVATGAWAPFLNSELGCRIPIEPGKGYSLTMPAPTRMPKIPIIFEDSHVAVTPLESSYRIGSTMEFVGYDTTINRKRLNYLKTSVEKYLHDPYCDPIEEEWYGWRPMTWDGKPVIDVSPKMKNVWVAAGHNMLGLSMATGTGKLVCELMEGKTPHVDPSHFSIARLG